MGIDLGNYAMYITVRNFLKKSKDEFCHSLKKNYRHVTECSLEEGQIHAWEDCYLVLHEALSQLPPEYEKLWLVFEYVLPRYNPVTQRFQRESHFRADVLLISKDTVLILEFKQSNDPYIGYFRQAKKYKKRIVSFHRESRNMIVEALLVLSKAEQYLDCVEEIIGCSPDLLHKQIRRLMGDAPKPHPNIKDWLKSRFSNAVETVVTPQHPSVPTDWKSMITTININNVHIEDLETLFSIDDLWLDLSMFTKDDDSIIVVLQHWAKNKYEQANITPDLQSSQYALVLVMDNKAIRIDFPTVDTAREAAMCTLKHWLWLALDRWSDCYDPTDDELSNYNNMIQSYFAFVVKLNADTNRYDTVWTPYDEYPPDKYDGGGVVLPPRNYAEDIEWQELDRDLLAHKKYVIENGVVY